MKPRTGESWRFEVACPHADSVFLVKLQDDAAKTWLPMKPTGPDVWSLEVALKPGRYRMSYYMQQGETFILGGSFGLSANRTSEPDPGVYLEPMETTCTA